MVDLKAHVFHGKSFQPLHGWALLAGIVAAAVITAAGFMLNAVFAFAIAKAGPAPDPRCLHPGSIARRNRPRCWRRDPTVARVAALYVDRWGHWWFAISMSFVIAIMMVAYVSLPARLIGMKTTFSKADKLKASVAGGAIGGVVCFPP